MQRLESRRGSLTRRGYLFIKYLLAFGNAESSTRRRRRTARVEVHLGRSTRARLAPAISENQCLHDQANETFSPAARRRVCARGDPLREMLTQRMAAQEKHPSVFLPSVTRRLPPGNFYRDARCTCNSCVKRACPWTDRCLNPGESVRYVPVINIQFSSRCRFKCRISDSLINLHQGCKIGRFFQYR